LRDLFEQFAIAKPSGLKQGRQYTHSVTSDASKYYTCTEIDPDICDYVFNIVVIVLFSLSGHIYIALPFLLILDKYFKIHSSMPICN
jgi:hypothetical protein